MNARSRIAAQLVLLTAWLGLAGSVARASDKSPRPEPRMIFLENGEIRVGIDLNLGGAITWLSRAGGENLVNSWDLGRQIQMSHYSGPAPFRAAGKSPAPHWEHLGWNPIQAGDDFGNGSRVLEHRREGGVLYTRCVPMQWPLDKVPADCEFETWLELDRSALKMRCRLKNAREDHAAYPARLQELPALYANAPYHRVVSYTGDRPFTGGAVSEIPRPAGKPDTWSHWMATERWSALVNDEGWGVGLWNSACVEFTGGFAGQPGPNDPRSLATGYLAPQAQEILDHNIVFEYRCEVILGTVAEIRARACGGGAPRLPAWRFERDRQGWHFQNAADGGWPLTGTWRLKLEEKDPQLVGPKVFFRAEEAGRLVIDAAFRTRDPRAELFWRKLDGTEGSLRFPVEGDGQMRRIEVPLAGVPGWSGGITRLRLDPEGSGAPGDSIEVRSIALEP